MSSTSSSSRRSTTAPTSHDGREIAEDRHPHADPDRQLLTDISDTVAVVDKEALQTVATELGAAFGGTGEDLQRIIDSGNSFIDAGRRQLRHHHRADPRQQHGAARPGRLGQRDPVLRPRPQRCSPTSLAGSDQALREVIDNGSATATQLRTFLEENEVDLGELINNLVTTGEVVVKHIDGVEQILVVYPYVVEGGFTVVSEVPRDRPLRRPLRHGPDPGPAGLPRAATRAPTPGRRRTAATGR